MAPSTITCMCLFSPCVYFKLCHAFILYLYWELCVMIYFFQRTRSGHYLSHPLPPVFTSFPFGPASAAADDVVANKIRLVGLFICLFVCLFVCLPACMFVLFCFVLFGLVFRSISTLCFMSSCICEIPSFVFVVCFNLALTSLFVCMVYVGVISVPFVWLPRHRLPSPRPSTNLFYLACFRPCWDPTVFALPGNIIR
jgi:hypothetical protein